MYAIILLYNRMGNLNDFLQGWVSIMHKERLMTNECLIIIIIIIICFLFCACGVLYYMVRTWVYKVLRELDNTTVGGVLVGPASPSVVLLEGLSCLVSVTGSVRCSGSCVVESYLLLWVLSSSCLPVSSAFLPCRQCPVIKVEYF